jgi:hypothetical protein
MRKYDELVKGFMANAHLHEMCFVLLARDKSAPVAIRAWIKHRIKTKKNKPDDAQIKEAELCAMIMEQEQPGAKNGSWTQNITPA